MRASFKPISIIFLLLMLSSCSEKDELRLPVVDIYKPVNKQVYTLPDDIRINFIVEHDRPIEYIRVSVDNSEMIPVSSAYYYYPGGNSYKVDFDVPVDILSEKVNAPPYYVHVAVSDFANVSNTYREVELNNGKMKYKGSLVIAKKDINILNISYIDDLFNDIFDYEINGSYRASGICNATSRLIIATQFPDYVRAFNSDDGSHVWTKEPQLPYPTFNKISIDDGKVYISSGIGHIIALDNSTGNQVFNTPVMRDTVPGSICLTNDYLISENILRNSGARLWVSYYKQTGTKYNMFITNLQAVDFYAVGAENDIVAFCNDDESGHIITFNVGGNYVYNDLVIDGKKIVHSCKIDGNNYLFISSSSIYIFNRNNEVFAKVIDIEAGAIDIKFNYINNQLFIAYFNNVEIFSYPGFDIIHNIETSDSVRGVELLYGY